MIWLETPTNPMLKLTDIKAVAESLKSHPDIILVIENTFLTSYFQVSLEKITIQSYEVNVESNCNNIIFLI